ncbi:hypothetical protein LIER_14403 [Lithospermum erythrorhizon]|uniref:RNA methyltransferase n=1 Tax=Lithospermum erythrorhizon TaxID=34254 RepID=A0AAV3PZ11_LITER
MGSNKSEKIDEGNKHKPKQNQTQPQNSDAKKRKRKEFAVFGNYRNYYGYRIGKNIDEDPRLKVMKKEWFEGKDCLDIGCNTGVVTTDIAIKFSCRSILGIDIDGDRIKDAHWHLRNIMNKKNRSKATPKQTPIDLEKDGKVDEIEGELNENPEELKDLFNVVSFEKGNIAQGWRPPANTKYHVILCLSVTKWVHLNWGDDGIITLFSKVWSHLHPGGVFIVEPQPWISYSKNRVVSETATVNYQKIKIRPEDFQDILLDKIGFRTVENIASRVSGSTAGFERPILALWK